MDQFSHDGQNVAVRRRTRRLEAICAQSPRPRRWPTSQINPLSTQATSATPTTDPALRSRWHEAQHRSCPGGPGDARRIFGLLPCSSPHTQIKPSEIVLGRISRSYYLLIKTRPNIRCKDNDGGENNGRKRTLDPRKCDDNRINLEPDTLETLLLTCSRFPRSFRNARK